MKKRLFFVLLCIASVVLTACGPRPPKLAADGSAWNGDWTLVGMTIGVEEPGHGLTIRDNNDILAAGQMFYATWSIGEAQPYVNDEGEEVDLYDAHLYLLLSGYNTQQDAQDVLGEWMELAEERYNIISTEEATYNGQPYMVITYTLESETNPYARGVSAFGVYGRWAISAELNCQESFDGDLREILTDFLNGCHYNVDYKEA